MRISTHLAVLTSTLAAAIAFPVEYANAAAFPLQTHSDGSQSYTANVMRRFAPTYTGTVDVINQSATSSSSLTKPLATASLVPGSVSGGSLIGDDPNELIDASNAGWRMVPSDPDNATATLRVELDRSYLLNSVYYAFGNTGDFRKIEIRTSADGSTWDDAFPLADAPNPSSTIVPFAARNARFVEFKVAGTNANYPMLKELRAFVAAEAANAPQTDEGYNYTYTNLVTSSKDTSIDPSTAQSFNQWTPWNNAADVVDRNIDSGMAAFGTGFDARAIIDLGSLQNVFHLSLRLYQGGNWSEGGKIEYSADGVGYTTLYDTNTIALGTDLNDMVDINFDPVLMQYLRVTNYKATGASWLETEVFVTAVPEPVSSVSLLMGLGAIAVRRRRR